MWLSFDITGFSGRLSVSVAVVVAEVVPEEVAEVVADVVEYGTFCTHSLLPNITRHTNSLDSQSEHSKLQTNENIMSLQSSSLQCWLPVADVALDVVGYGTFFTHCIFHDS